MTKHSMKVETDENEVEIGKKRNSASGNVEKSVFAKIWTIGFWVYVPDDALICTNGQDNGVQDFIVGSWGPMIVPH
ncbi:uncharacterized protein HKW66_Vig0037790 [Vigna angularis]|uniref:Uncharacterized protein n=1 Tax=Phaseolus angularis TaxID=3914 RepID=A0A8T0LA49_PHAAN|nr:uncharacterized protein HKW66_Vig0037790 [Vigna angularis]